LATKPAAKVRDRLSVVAGKMGDHTIWDEFMGPNFAKRMERPRLRKPPGAQQTSVYGNFSVF
jgi:hypothetical protein